MFVKNEDVWEGMAVVEGVLSSYSDKEGELEVQGRKEKEGPETRDLRSWLWGTSLGCSINHQ